MRKSIKRRVSVFAGAIAICVVTGAVLAMPVSAHIVAGIDATCEAVTVHFMYFPDNPIPVTIVVQAAYAPPITQVVQVSNAQDVSVSIANVTSHLTGQTVPVTVDVTWTLFGDNHVHQQPLVTCGTATTTTTHPTTTTTHPTTTTSTSTTTTTRPASTRGDLFQVELRRCSQVHEGYTKFPAGTVVRWKVIQSGVTMATGQFAALGGSDNHFITQNLGTRLKASPQMDDVHYTWTINGVGYRYLVRRAPGCSGTTSTGASGPGNIFVVELRSCQLLHSGYQYFPSNIALAWMVKQGTKSRIGSFPTSSGSDYHFVTESLGMTLSSASKAAVTFYWTINLTHYHYAVTRTTGC